MSALRGVLLDVDGTLLDSNAAHAQAFADVFREAGFDIGWERVLPLIGMGGDKLLPELTGHPADEGLGKELAEAKKARFRDHYLPSLQPTPGARDLVQRLKAIGLVLVVATSAGGDEVTALLRQAGIADLLPDTTTASDADNSKPDPDIIVAALAKAGLPPEAVVMLGDTPYDIEASARAGVGCVALRSGGWLDRDLGGAIAVYDHPADLVARFDASPFSDSFSGAAS